MNARDSTAYFKSIGLDLIRTDHEVLRWKIMVPDGHGHIMHFHNLKHLWGFVACQAFSHFQQVEQAEEVLRIVASKSHPDWEKVDAWFHHDTCHLPAFVTHIQITHPKVSMPRHWKARYAKLIQSYGRAELPLFGRTLCKGMLALHDQNPAFCCRPTTGSGHAKRRTARVDRAAA